MWPKSCGSYWSVAWRADCKRDLPFYEHMWMIEPWRKARHRNPGDWDSAEFDLVVSTWYSAKDRQGSKWSSSSNIIRKGSGCLSETMTMAEILALREVVRVYMYLAKYFNGYGLEDDRKIG